MKSSEQSGELSQKTKMSLNLFHRILWMLYVTLITLIGFMVIIRFSCLCLKMEWRNDLKGGFPEACGAWAEDMGCTRVAL